MEIQPFVEHALVNHWFSTKEIMCFSEKKAFRHIFWIQKNTMIQAINWDRFPNSKHSSRHFETTSIIRLSVIYPIPLHPCMNGYMPIISLLGCASRLVSHQKP